MMGPMTISSFHLEILCSLFCSQISRTNHPLSWFILATLDHPCPRASEVWNLIVFIGLIASDQNQFNEYSEKNQRANQAKAFSSCH